ncbi:MAG: hypothetical protein EXR75_01800 [Myxococcales bacterium]|nr:hypothetical protein [Myxococcales bacterium]
MRRTRSSLFLAASTLLVSVAGCGYSEEEWQAQLDKHNRLQAHQLETQRKLGDSEKELAVVQERIASLERDLETAGVDLKQLGTDLDSRTAELSKAKSTLEEREAALAEYKRRADQLERIKQRFEQLRSKLTELTSLGLVVRIRNNRMMISLPGDVLFDTGKDSLKKEGEQILQKVAEIINSDASLRARFYQVAGHTDDQALRGGIFRDNWGLSLMRARTVLIYLVNPDGGALPLARWSASGYADTDPMEPNDSPDGRMKNRRCELVVVPSAEEMLDLKAIAQ